MTEMHAPGATGVGRDGGALIRPCGGRASGEWRAFGQAGWKWLVFYPPHLGAGVTWLCPTAHPSPLLVLYVSTRISRGHGDSIPTVAPESFGEWAHYPSGSRVL